MPNISLTSEELTTIASALDTELKSASRAQKSGKTPQIIEVHKLHEATLQELRGKIMKAAQSK